MKNSGWKLDTLGALGGGSRGRGGLTRRSVMESAARRLVEPGAGARLLALLLLVVVEVVEVVEASLSPSWWSAVRDLARWIPSTVGGVMCLDSRLPPPPCFVNSFRALGAGEAAGVES